MTNRLFAVVFALVTALSSCGIWETRIASVEQEFMRRSPSLHGVFADFRGCGPECSATETARILSLRDQVIANDWPRIFDRLIVKNDWGQARETKIARGLFFSDVAELGAERLRNKCVPRIEFRWPVLGGTKVAIYNFAAFVCNDSPPSLGRG